MYICAGSSRCWKVWFLYFFFNWKRDNQASNRPSLISPGRKVLIWPWESPQFRLKRQKRGECEKNRKQHIKQMGLETQPGSREWHWVQLCPWKVVPEKKKKLSQRCAKPPAFDLGGSKWDTTSRAEQSRAELCTAHSKGSPTWGEQEKERW